jgi:amino acid transporter
MSATIRQAAPSEASEGPGRQCQIGWQAALSIAVGVPALVLTSIGAIAAMVGPPAWAIWTVSMLLGFIVAFGYVASGGLFRAKSGGASVDGAVAWVRYRPCLAVVAGTPVVIIARSLADTG